jgi:hypothetical protein
MRADRDPYEATDRADLDRGNAEREQDARDRAGEKGPAPDVPGAEDFVAAAERGASIWEAASGPQALAGAVGTTQTHLIKLASGLSADASETYGRQGLSPAAVSLCTVADALLLGMLVGRELPR